MRIQHWKIKYKGRSENFLNRKKVSSENRRCPRCKKIRKMWIRANAYCRLCRIRAKYVSGEGKICWICVIREIVPNWRPGMEIPKCLIPGHKW